MPEKKGASFAVHDIDGGKLNEIRKEGVPIIESPEEIAGYKYLIDATSQGGWLHRNMLHPEVWIAAPGIPLSLDKEAYEAFMDQTIHDPLQIGAASMLGLTL